MGWFLFFMLTKTNFQKRQIVPFDGSREKKLSRKKTIHHYFSGVLYSVTVALSTCLTFFAFVFVFVLKKCSTFLSSIVLSLHTIRPLDVSLQAICWAIQNRFRPCKLDSLRKLLTPQIIARIQKEMFPFSCCTCWIPSFAVSVRCWNRYRPGNCAQSLPDRDLISIQEQVYELQKFWWLLVTC